MRVLRAEGHQVMSAFFTESRSLPEEVGLQVLLLEAKEVTSVINQWPMWSSWYASIICAQTYEHGWSLHAPFVSKVSVTV